MDLIIMVGTDHNLASESLSRVIKAMEEREMNIIAGLSIEDVKERVISDIEVEIKTLDLPNRLELNEIVLLKPVMADKHQIIESRKPKWSEGKAIRQAKSKDYYRRKR